VAFLYWRTTGGVRLALVVLSSYFFYMSWLPVYGLLLLALTAINFALAIALDKTRIETSNSAAVETEKPARTKLHKSIFAFGVLFNLAVLVFYKYVNFLIENVVDTYNFAITQLNALPALKVAQALPWDKPVLDVILPLGISFFIFEFVHYLVDVYRGDKPLTSFMEFAAFASFFPSQIAGPIKRYKDFTDRLRQPEPMTAALFTEGTTLIVQGLFKKVAIADPIGVIVNGPFASTTMLSGPDAWIASIGFVIQVYCDFSGYTDIGRGSALWLGIRLPENFNLPYLATDLSDFWRRWHISLSSWLRDYIYIPLGGSRKSVFMAWRNLFITMVACGIWHGASWHYVLFGMGQGIGLGVNREWRLFLNKHPGLSKICESRGGLLFSNFLLMTFITLSYAVFRSPDVPHSINMLRSMLNFPAPCTLLTEIDKMGVGYILGLYMAFFFICNTFTKSEFLMSVAKSIGLSSDGKTFGLPVRMASWTAAFVLMFAARPTEAIPFVYFQF